MSQPVVSRTLESFVNAIIKKASKFIYMPRSAAEREIVKQDFFAVAGFPGVIGADPMFQ